MRIFLTGGTGFFGKTLVRALAERGDEVRVLARASSDTSGLDVPGVTLVRGGIEDDAVIREGMDGVDAFFHGAAVVKELVKDKTIFDRVNVDALDRAMTIAREAGVKKVVYTSSFFAIGPSDQAPNRVADETWKREQRYCTDYERTKYLAEAKVDAQVEAGCPIVSVLPGFIMGPGNMTEGNLIVRTLLDLEAGKLPVLPGGGKKLWCLAYIEDVVNGHLLALEKGTVGERYLIGGDNPSLIEILREYQRLGGHKPPAISVPFPVTDVVGWMEEMRWKVFGADPMLSRGKACAARHDWAYSSEKAKRDLGYEWLPWKESFGRTFQWMKEEGLVGAKG